MRSRKSLVGLVALMLVAMAVPSARAAGGPNVQATVSFGQWQTDPPFDRFEVPDDRTRNTHRLIPQEVHIKTGGAVNFIIAGLHEPVVYDVGTSPDEIDTDAVLSTTPPLIDDPTNRIYRGANPLLLPQDRVESVTFVKPGTYLVICAVHPHFVNDNMFGFVKVTGPDRSN